MGTQHDSDDVGRLLGEQVAYYRAVAAEYGDHALLEPGGDELDRALEAFKPAGDSSWHVGPGRGRESCCVTRAA
jgi:hypothetical protein